MRLKRTIHLKLALVVSLTALLITCFSSALVYFKSYQNTLTESERSVTQLMMLVKQTSAVAAYTGNRPIAEDVVNSLVQNDLVHFAKIVGQNHLKAYAGGRRSNELRSILLPAPFNPEETIGSLAVEVNTELMLKRASSEAINASLVLIAQAFLLALTVYLAVYRFLSRPLTQLSGLLHEIIPGSPGRLPSREEKSADELTRLTQDINALLDMVQTMVQDERDIRHNLAMLEKRFRGMFESASIGIILIDEHGKLRLANPAFHHIQEMAGQAQILNQDSAEWIPQLFLYPHRLWLLADESRQRGLAMSEDLQTHNGWLHTIVAAASDDEGKLCFQCLFYDITIRKNEEEATRKRADFDHLTGIHNRQSGDRILEQMVTQASNERHNLAVMMIDLDRFKHINDTYGHEAGDIVLVEVAKRLRSSLRQEDLVSRLGGDEFMVVLSELRNHDFVSALATELIQKISMPISLKPNVYEHVGASIGIAFYPMHGDTAYDLRCNADRAMYEVKRKGRNDYAVFSYEMSAISDSD